LINDLCPISSLSFRVSSCFLLVTTYLRFLVTSFSLIFPIPVVMASKAKTASNGSAAPKVKQEKPTNGTSAEKVDTLAAGAAGKPDKKVYDAEQESIKLEIDALQVKLVGQHMSVLYTCH
jgi:hypothetical protein